MIIASPQIGEIQGHNTSDWMVNHNVILKIIKMVCEEEVEDVKEELRNT